MTAVDDALDRLEEELTRFLMPRAKRRGTPHLDDIATVRDTLDRLREVEAAHEHLSSEYHFDQDRGDHLVYAREWEAFDAWQRGDLSFERMALAAEAEVQRLREERDGLQRDVQFQYERRKGAEAEVQRYREGLRVALTMIERASFDAHDREWAREQTTNLRALLAASPPDGGGAK